MAAAVAAVALEGMRVVFSLRNARLQLLQNLQMPGSRMARKVRLQRAFCHARGLISYLFM